MHAGSNARGERVLLVEDGFQRGALAAARSFGRAGWFVGCASPRRGWAARSRYVSRWHRIPPPQEGARFVASVSAAVRDGGYRILFPVGDAEVVALSAERADLGAIFPYPRHDAVVRALDKDVLAKIARACGVATPRTYALGRDDALPAEVVVKERARGTHARRSATHMAATEADARARAAKILAGGGEAVLQEALPGPLVGYTALVDGAGRVVAELQQVADRTWPPRAGGSTRAELVPVDAELAAGARAVLRELGWFGLVQLQYVLAADGVPRLIDLNGRFYGSLALAMKAGVDFPLMWAQLALGQDPPEPARRVRAVRYQWLEGDLRRALVERRGGLATDVWDCLRYARGAAHATWSFADPAPTGTLVALLARRAAGKAFRSAQRAR
jgi:predicted ATP-grasp superfamily ATP-dependent carboligase